MSSGYARLASRLSECACVVVSLVLAVCLTAAEQERHQIWECVRLLLLRESAIVLATLDVAPQPSVMPRMTVLLETHVNAGVTKATLGQVLALQRGPPRLVLAEVIVTVQMSTTSLTHSVPSVGSRNQSTDTATGAITSISSKTRAIMVRHTTTG